MKTAIFAAGCFWGVQYYFDQVPGVVETIVGYSGGHTENPTYEEVCTRPTGHAEALKVVYDPKQISYDTLLRHFFRMHDPTQRNRQGPDIGEQYRSAIFYTDEYQRRTAATVIDALSSQYDKPIVTELSKAKRFYEAESSHQKFSERTGRGMCHVPYKSIDD